MPAAIPLWQLTMILKGRLGVVRRDADSQQTREDGCQKASAFGPRSTGGLPRKSKKEGARRTCSGQNGDRKWLQHLLFLLKLLMIHYHRFVQETVDLDHKIYSGVPIELGDLDGTSDSLAGSSVSADLTPPVSDTQDWTTAGLIDFDDMEPVCWMEHNTAMFALLYPDFINTDAARWDPWPDSNI